MENLEDVWGGKTRSAGLQSCAFLRFDLMLDDCIHIFLVVYR
jgi:hypothetical protein